MHLSAGWRATALVFVLVAAALPLAARALVGPPGALVHVRWQPSVDAAARQRLEARFRLADGQRLDASTWRYDLIDPSSEIIRALVGDPAVEDTHDIDRARATLQRSATRTARRQRLAVGGDALVRTADALALVLCALAGLLAAMGMSGHAATPRAVPAFTAGTLRAVSTRVRAATMPVVLWLQRGIPEVDARTAGAFRLVFGTALLIFFGSHQVTASWLSATFDVKVNGELHPLVLQWLGRHPHVVDLLAPWLLTTGIAFTLGLFTRLTYALFAGGVIIWAFVAVSLDSTHPHSTLVLAVVALLPSRWGDAFSLDAWWRRNRGPRTAPGKHYGYSVWAPGLVFGIAFAAAAWSKLAGGREWTSWILTGSVQYHFITDARNAPVDWGLQLVNYPWLAVLASFGTVAIETVVITAAFTRSELYRFSMGIAALGMLAGFRLFMGVVWWGWWILLVGFLPWQRLGLIMGRLPPDATYVASGFSRTMHGRTISAAQLAAVVFVIAQQIVVSTLAIERAPMFTYYPMYAASWASLEEFNASRPPVYRIVASTDRGTIELPCRPAERLVTEFRAALSGSAEAAASVWRQLRGCGADLTGVRHVVFEGSRHRFDLERLAFAFASQPGAIVLGPLAADEDAIAADAP